MIDVETEFGRCVQSAGGKLIGDLIGAGTGFENADYLFESDQVIAELKCLAEDKGNDAGVIAKASALYEECFRSGQAPVVVFGTAKITTSGFPESFSRQIVELYRRPIHRRIAKANRQIRSIGERLGKANHRGLLLLVNDGHTFLDPRHLVGLVQETLARNTFRSINSVVILTVNLPAKHSQRSRDVRVWIELARSAEDACDDAFLEKLQGAWFGRLSLVTGETVSRVDIQGAGFLLNLRNRPRERSGSDPAVGSFGHDRSQAWTHVVLRNPPP